MYKIKGIRNFAHHEGVRGWGSENIWTVHFGKVCINFQENKKNDNQMSKG